MNLIGRLTEVGTQNDNQHRVMEEGRNEGGSRVQAPGQKIDITYEQAIRRD